MLIFCCNLKMCRHFFIEIAVATNRKRKKNSYHVSTICIFITGIIMYSSLRLFCTSIPLSEQVHGFAFFLPFLMYSSSSLIGVSEWRIFLILRFSRWGFCQCPCSFFLHYHRCRFLNLNIYLSITHIRCHKFLSEKMAWLKGDDADILTYLFNDPVQRF